MTKFWAGGRPPSDQPPTGHRGRDAGSSPTPAATAVGTAGPGSAVRVGSGTSVLVSWGAHERVICVVRLLGPAGSLLAVGLAQGYGSGWSLAGEKAGSRAWLTRKRMCRPPRSARSRASPGNPPLTGLIAERGGGAVRSLYRYFPDSDSIAE